MLAASAPTLDPRVTDAVDALLREVDRTGRQLLGLWLFGSQVRGEATADSDVDLAVLCEPPLGPLRFELMDRLGNAIDVDVDVIDLAVTAPGLVWEVITTGRLIVERDSGAIQRFVRHARFDAEDEQRRLRNVLSAVAGASRHSSSVPE